jgi:RecQ zinc-binding
MMRDYAETTGCRRQFLLGYFGEQLPGPCGNCNTCDAGTAQHRDAAARGFEVNSVVRHPEWGPGSSCPASRTGSRSYSTRSGTTLALAAVEHNNLVTPRSGAMTDRFAALPATGRPCATRPPSARSAGSAASKTQGHARPRARRPPSRGRTVWPTARDGSGRSATDSELTATQRVIGHW